MNIFLTQTWAYKIKSFLFVMDSIAWSIVIIFIIISKMSDWTLTTSSALFN